jgi:N-acetyllactosaminide beta-1,6-N-acetylglucosaminyltransferase
VTYLLNLDNLINLEKHPRLEKKRVIEWKYWLNLPGTFLPIRTNLELTRILSMCNGASDVHILKHSGFDWRHKQVHLLDSNNQVADTGKFKSAPPFNFTVFYGSNYIAASRLFADYIR